VAQPKKKREGEKEETGFILVTSVEKKDLAALDSLCRT
jgi:hypothetical protein